MHRLYSWYEICGADSYEHVDCCLVEYGSSLMIEPAASSGKLLKDIPGSTA
jgi:hypothetical protein